MPFKHFHIFSLLLIFILAFTVRFIDLGSHFAHYDDAFMYADVFRAQAPNFRQELLDSLYDQNRPHYADQQKIFIRKIYDNPRTRFIFDAGVYLARFLILPLDSNIAPLQLTLFTLLASPNYSYRLNLFLGRLPSFIFGFLTVYLMFLSLKKKTNFPALLLGLLLCALSLESIIQSKFAPAYALGCFASAGLLLLFQYSQERDFFQKHWLRSGILTSLFVYSHYQLVFFLPAYYLANLWLKRKNIVEIKNLIWSGAINFLLCVPALFFLVFVHGAGAEGGHYTIGKFGEFLFNPGNKSIFYPIYFLLKNSFLVITHTLSPVTAAKGIYWLCGIFFFGAFWHGLGKIRKQPEFIYITLCFLTYLLLVLSQRLAMTPTRQSLAYLPILIYPIAQSLSSWQRKYNIIYLLLICYLGIFLYFFPGFVRERKDPLQEKELLGLIEKYNPDIIIGYRHTVHLALFPQIRQQHNYIDGDHNLYLNKPLKQYHSVAFFSTWAELDADNFAKSQQIWNKQTGKAWTIPYQQYKIVYQKIVTSNIEHEPNFWNSNGANSLFFYVLNLK